MQVHKLCLPRLCAAIILALVTTGLIAEETSVDRFGDSLPSGAIARLGTVRFRHAANSITGVAFSPDGKLMATATNNSPDVMVFDSETGKRVARFGPEPGENLYWLGNTLTFSPDGSAIYIMPMGMYVERLDLKTLQRTRLTEQWEIRPKGFQLSPDGTKIAIPDRDDKVNIREYPSGKEIVVLSQPRKDVGSMSFSADGKFLAIGDKQEKKVEVWDLAANKVVWEKPIDGHNFDVALSPNGQLVAFKPAGQGFAVYSRQGEEPLFVQERGSYSKPLVFSPDGSKLVAKNSRKWEVWDLRSGELEHKIDVDYFTSDVYFSPDNKRLAIAQSSHAVRMFDVEDAKERPTYETHISEIKRLAVNQDGSRVMSNAFGDCVFVWDAATQKAIFHDQTGSQSPKALTLTADGKRAVYGWGKLKFVAPESGESLAELRVWRDCEALQPSPDGKLLATADQQDGKYGISIIDMETATRRGWLPTERGVVHLAWLPDGEQLVSAEGNGDISLWKLDGETPIRKFHKEKVSGVQSMSIHPAGKVLVAVEGGHDSTIRFYRIDSGESIAGFELEGYQPSKMQDKARQVAFSGDGQYLAALVGPSVLIWDIRSRKLVTKIGDGGNWYSHIVWSGDGKRLVTVSQHDHILVWDLVELIASANQD